MYATRAGDSNFEDLYSLNAADGSILWRSQDLIDEYGSETPAFAVNDDLIIGNSRSVTRINHVNGKTVWKTPRSCPFSGSCGVAVLGAHAYVADGTNSDGVLDVFDVATGCSTNVIHE